MAPPIEIMPEVEQHMHQPGQYCSCKPIIEPGESPTIVHRSLTPGDNTTPVRMTDE